LAAALQPGDPVEVVSGIMKGQTGQFKAVDGVDRDKLVIKIPDDILGHSHTVHLSITDIDRYFQVGDFVKIREGSQVRWVMSCNRPHVTFHDMATSQAVRISYSF
jgi:transcription elongation factor